MTEQCSGTTGDMSDVSWYVVPGVDAILDGDITVVGYWSRISNRIVLAGAEQKDGGTIRHEMLHALLRNVGHPRNQFLVACGGVVPCDSYCISEAGPPPAPDPTWRTVPPESTAVSIAIGPPAPSGGQYDGTFMVIVTARNASNHGVVVQLYRGPGTGISFSYRMDQGPISGNSYNVLAVDPGVAYFGPNETKRMVFDFVVGGNPARSGVTPGTYQLSGGYGLFFTSPTPLTVAP